MNSISTHCTSLTVPVEFQHASSEPIRYSLCLMFLNVIDIFLFIERFKIKKANKKKKNLKLQMYEVHWAASVGEGGPGFGGLFLFVFFFFK